MAAEKIYEPYKKERGTMIYNPTNEQMSSGSFVEKVANFIENLYWMYYIHFPFYLMTSFDSFCLHALVLVLFCLSFFGILKYFFM